MQSMISNGKPKLAGLKVLVIDDRKPSAAPQKRC